MRQARFSEEQIVAIPEDGRRRRKRAHLYRRLGIREQIFSGRSRFDD